MKSDLVVVGSGGTGLTAALAAACGGASVVVLERTALFGGTTATSGGSLWIPDNRFMREAGIADSREDALTYILRLTMGKVSESLVECFVDRCNSLIEFLERETNLTFAPNLAHPDYHPEFAGGKQGGRTLQNDLYDTRRLGDLKDKVRSGATTLPLTKLELDTWGKRTSDMKTWDFNLIAQRMEAGIVGLGRGLVGELMEACLRNGVQLISEARALELTREGDRVSGVLVERDGQTEQFDADVAVVLASGGFEWNTELIDRFMTAPLRAPSSPPCNEGDGLRMAMTVGAALGNMTEAWWAPAISIPGETIEGHAMHRHTTDLRSLPGSLMVNRTGRRFVNEAINYNDATKALLDFDPANYEFANLPCWMIFDQQFRRSYSIATVSPDSKTPGWLNEANTLEELAQRLGIDAAGLVAQVAEFNAHAARGEDPVFHRGEGAYDRYRGDPRIQPNPNVRVFGDGPYYALELEVGALGTKGGPVTDEAARVQDVHGKAIPGLYAVGNVSASVFGPGYPGAGATLGSGMTFALLAGSAIVNQIAERSTALV
jgi:succinate dehydrogenase/fumarate reductase flavoprotein subunit